MLYLVIKLASMLPFFRKIRWRLAANNQFFKYSRYAIGEIVLVVVGILIALYINNWNEERKGRKIGTALLKNLTSDLIRNQELLTRDILWHKNAVNSINILVKVHKENIPYHDSLQKHFDNARKFPDPRLSFAAYQEIKNKGLDFISSPELKKKIIDLYEVSIEDMIVTLNRLEGALRPTQMSHQLQNFEAGKNKLIPTNKNTIMQDEVYLNIISQRLSYTDWSIRMKEQLIKDMTEVLNLIQAKLQK